MKARSLLTVLVLSLALAAVFAAPALATTPFISDLASPTHPNQWETYYSNDPEFTWSTSPGPYGWCDTPGDAWAVDLDGGFAYVADDYGESLRVIDASIPAELTARGAYGHLGAARGVDVVGSVAYVSSWADPNGLVAIDVSNPDAPQLLGTFWTADWGMDVKVVGSYAYVPADYAGFYVIDVSDPATMHEEGRCTVGLNAHGVDVAGNYAYVAWGEHGLVVVDITDPANPVPVTTFGLEGRDAEQVAVAGDRAYVIASGDLFIVDITDPTTPVLLSWVETPGWAYGVAVDGTTVYVGDGDAGVSIVDASDPYTPIVVKELDTQGNARGVAFESGLVYVADGGNGLVVLDSNPVASDPECSYSYSIDQTPDTPADEGAEGATPAASFTDLADGTWWFHVRAVDDGVWGPTAHYQVNIDHRPHITSLTSITHYQGYWSGNNDPQFEWLTDVPCDAYSYAIGRYDAPEPDNLPDPVEDVVHPSVTLTDVPDGELWFRVRARDLEGNWGPMAQYYVLIKATGPTTMAVATKTAKRGGLFLQYSVHDVVNWSARVAIEIRSASGVIVRTIDCGWRQFEVVWSAAVSPALPRGRYNYTVHAWDWLGNPESQAGTAAFIVR